MARCKDKFANVLDFFGENVFSDKVMKERLSENYYNEFQQVLNSGLEMNKNLADEIARAMKDWAIEKGASHYTHWFQPLTGTTAEKHDSFIDVDKSGNVILDFCGKQLIKGEADASSFPSGGTRATFEARGYTVWDCTSPAFIRESKNGGSTVLCIPTAFCSYNGEALDKKTPLLRAMDAINKESLRVLRLLGNTTTKKVFTNLGAEQEYFLIKKEHYNKRKDLIFTGRTLFGTMPPKGQEMNDQYYASIRDCVSAYMNELNIELWKLGITAKTQHNEVAPSQHELAPIYTTTNIGTDHNQLIMEMMKKIADRNGLACILHEKPFAGVNGSGKHNNWSICTDDGVNLLSPGKTPNQNQAFLVFFTSVIKAVSEYQELIRMSSAHAGNDHRLGGHEAPPAIVSVYVGEELEELLREIESCSEVKDKQKTYLKVGATLPTLKKDTSDRNRTSPFAFTGNKFEFRMVGSSQSTATPNVIICVAVAEILSRVAKRLEKGEDIMSIIRSNITDGKVVMYNGNNYSKEWADEAARRNLKNNTNSVDAYKCLSDKKTIDLFEKHSVMTEVEIHSRQEIYYENYAKTLNIEALTMISMAYHEIMPAVNNYLSKLLTVAANLKAARGNSGVSAQDKLIARISALSDSLYETLVKLEEKVEHAKSVNGSNEEKATIYRDTVLPCMNTLRSFADALEAMMAKEDLPYPTYADLLFYD